MNKPYVKQYENGVLANPIEKTFESKFPNRRARRLRDVRLFNNRNTYPTKVIKFDSVDDNGKPIQAFEKMHPRIQLLRGKFIKRGVAKKFKAIIHYN